MLRLDGNAARGEMYVAFQLYLNTVVLETFLDRDLAWLWRRRAHELVHQTCWGQVSDGSHHTRSEVTGLNEVDERLESVPAQCDAQNSRKVLRLI